jgi:hypothetical protein
MTEKIEVEGPRGPTTYRFDCGSDLRATQLRAWHGTQPAGRADGDRQRSVARAGHRREDNRQLDSE